MSYSKEKFMEMREKESHSWDAVDADYFYQQQPNLPNQKVVNLIITFLNEMEVDGQTMEYIITKTGMREQMINQLYLYPLQYQAEQQAIQYDKLILDKNKENI
jgi:hypothetical protein